MKKSSNQGARERPQKFATNPSWLWPTMYHLTSFPCTSPLGSWKQQVIINYSAIIINYSSTIHQLFIHYSSSIHQLSSVIINDHQLSSVINDSLIINYSAITQAFCAKSPIFRPSFSSMKARIGAMPVPSATISMGVLCFSGKVTLKGTRGARVLRWNLGLNVGWCWMMLDDVGWCWMMLDDVGWCWMMLDAS